MIFLVLFLLCASRALVPSLNVKISGSWSITIQLCYFEFQEFFPLPSHWHPQFKFSPSVGRRNAFAEELCRELHIYLSFP